MGIHMDTPTIQQGPFLWLSNTQRSPRAGPKPCGIWYDKRHHTYSHVIHIVGQGPQLWWALAFHPILRCHPDIFQADLPWFHGLLLGTICHRPVAKDDDVIQGFTSILGIGSLPHSDRSFPGWVFHKTWAACGLHNNHPHNMSNNMRLSVSHPRRNDQTN